jgi:hypothetical protein
MPDHLEVTGDVIKNPGDVLTDLAHLAAAGRAGAARLVHDVAGRQMRRQFARADFLRSGGDDCSTADDGSPLAAKASSDAAGVGSSASNSSSLSSSCSIVRAIFSDERPNCIRRSRAICNLSFSTSSAFAMRPALAAASSASRASQGATGVRHVANDRRHGLTS